MISSTIDGKVIEQLRTLVEGAKHIVITCHVSPDGDAVGSTLGLCRVLRNMGKDAHVVMPDRMPRALDFVDVQHEVVPYSKYKLRGRFLVREADLIFCLDFNVLRRIDELGAIIEESRAPRVLIDHHLEPDDCFDVKISQEHASSTCELVYRVLMQLGWTQAIDSQAASCLYVGITTDTGNLTYSSNDPELYEIVAQLLRCGIAKEQLYNLDLVRTPADFFDLTPAKLSLLDGWKEKSIQRFLRSLADCRKIPFARVLFAIGIRYVGEQTAKDVAAHFGSIDTLAEASVEQLLEVPDIGDVTARAIYAWFREPTHQVEIQRLKAAGLQFSAEAPRENQSDALKGLSIVISGNFSISRDEMKELIERNGGKNSSGVSAKTTYLLAGSKPGPEKIRKAQELGVEIIDEARLMSMLPEHAGQEMSKTLFGDFEEPTLF